MMTTSTVQNTSQQTAADDRQKITELVEKVSLAYSKKEALFIAGGGSKLFYGHPVETENRLDITTYHGVVSYEPSELVITVRAGTLLSEVEQLLDANAQQLPFEPPHFNEKATIGGAIATGLSGPRRPYAGSVRDAVLGVKMINGKGEVLVLGGQVMKNVAGYDISRLMAGSLGILGVLLEISIKVVPKPAGNRTLVREEPLQQALDRMHQWARMSLPVTATAWVEGKLYTRLSGSEETLKESHQSIGGELLNDGGSFWTDLREQRLSFFENPQPLWRMSISASTDSGQLPGEQLVEWGGALRWLKSDAAPAEICTIAKQAGGHATAFALANPVPSEAPVFAPLSSPLMKLHRELKRSFDPAGILNPGRMYREL